MARPSEADVRDLISRAEDMRIGYEKRITNQVKTIERLTKYVDFAYAMGYGDGHSPRDKDPRPRQELWDALGVMADLRVSL